MDEERSEINSGTIFKITEIKQLRFEALRVRRNILRFFNTPRVKRLRIDVGGHTTVQVEKYSINDSADHATKTYPHNDVDTQLIVAVRIVW